MTAPVPAIVGLPAETAGAAGPELDPDLATDLAAAALALARRLHAGATLWCVSPQWEPHAHHIAVEFVHPVIVGKRALPALALTARDVVAQARVCVRPGDVIIAVAGAGDPAAAELMTRAPAWGAQTIWIGSGEPASARRGRPRALARRSGPAGTRDRAVRAALSPALGTHPRVLRAPRAAHRADPGLHR